MLYIYIIYIKQNNNLSTMQTNIKEFFLPKGEIEKKYSSLLENGFDNVSISFDTEMDLDDYLENTDKKKLWEIISKNKDISSMILICDYIRKFINLDPENYVSSSAKNSELIVSEIRKLVYEILCFQNCNFHIYEKIISTKYRRIGILINLLEEKN